MTLEAASSNSDCKQDLGFQHSVHSGVNADGVVRMLVEHLQFWNMHKAAGNRLSPVFTYAVSNM